MPPDLVVANAPYRFYRGGVIAFRATDWLGAARGTLSTEVNALAGNGEVVRDSQQVTGIKADNWAAYDSALDTLVIPMSGVPIEDNLNYRVFVSYRIEGEWDVTNLPLIQGCNNLVFNDVVEIGMHGTAQELENEPASTEYALCRIPYFAMGYIGLLHDVDSTQTIRFRAFSEDGTTAEWLIDQIVFLPDYNNTNWLADDFVDIYPTDTLTLLNPVEDGADGGDANGKFTLIAHDLPATKDDLMVSFSAGDYQQKASSATAEYLLHVVAEDGYKVVNTEPTPDAESGTDAYSLHCVRYRGEIVWADDDFSNRTTSPDDWGLSPEGYGYTLGGTFAQSPPPQAFVSGGVGVLRLQKILETVSATFGYPVSNPGAELTGDDQWEYSGVAEHTAGVLSAGRWRISADNAGASATYTWEIRLDIASKTWYFGRVEGGGSFVDMGSPHDISGWWGIAAPLGWRIESKRYIIRCRVWDASGAEPGTWDEEMFAPVQSAGVVAYPYSDTETLAQLAYTSHSGFGIGIESTSPVGNTFPYDISVSSMKFEHDPYGDPADMSVSMERPHGTEVAQIVVPYGCAYFVYWGSRDWTDLDGVTPAYAEFSAKVWNDTTAAEIQWADAPFWYFRSQHAFIIPMNWRSSTREGGWKRVLKGNNPI